MSVPRSCPSWPSHHRTRKMQGGMPHPTGGYRWCPVNPEVLNKWCSTAATSTRIIEYFYQEEALRFLYWVSQPAIKPRVSLSPACITASPIHLRVASHFTSEGWRQKSRTVTRDRGTETHPWPPLPEHPPTPPPAHRDSVFSLHHI